MAYDPVKAHEYYMRTRKLKGRKKGKGKLSSAQRAIKKLAKSKLREQRKQALQAARDAVKAHREKIKADLKKQTPYVRSMMKELVAMELQRIATDYKTQSESIKKDYQAKIDAVK
jgi:hypothetical protein